MAQVVQVILVAQVGVVVLAIQEVLARPVIPVIQAVQATQEVLVRREIQARLAVRVIQVR